METKRKNTALHYDFWTRLRYKAIMDFSQTTALLALLLSFLVLVVALYLTTLISAKVIARKNPPIGHFIEIDGVDLHFLIVRATNAPANAQPLSPVIFIHGASGNLKDQYFAFRNKLNGQYDAIFIDRPGHGWSERGKDCDKYPDKQADYIVKLLNHLGYHGAIVVGHSFGCTLALSLALKVPERIKGVLCLAPVAYPWPGGIAWYYKVAATPIIGHIFTHLFTLPAGLKRVPIGSRHVFLPNLMPRNYIRQTSPELVLRPNSFRNNSKDIANLEDFVTKTWPLYKTITTPTIIISGKQDNVVFPYIHSKGLAWDLGTAELIELKHVGHKPDYIATELALAAIDKLQGNDLNLNDLAKDTDDQLS